MTNRTPTDHDPIHPMTGFFALVVGFGFPLLCAMNGYPL